MAPSRANQRKATFNLPEDLLTSLDLAVQQGVAPSKNAFVELAIFKELESVRRAERARLWEEASNDPSFLRDLEELATAFELADAESFERTD